MFDFLGVRPFLPEFDLEACVLFERELALGVGIDASRLLASTFLVAMLAPFLAVVVGTPGLDELVGLQIGESRLHYVYELSSVLC